MKNYIAPVKRFVKKNKTAIVCTTIGVGVGAASVIAWHKSQPDLSLSDEDHEWIRHGYGNLQVDTNYGPAVVRMLVTEEE